MNCFFCKGSLEESVTTHVVDLKKCIVIIKNVPCTECSQCGETFFDNDVVSQLEIIVNSFKNAITEIAVVNYSDQVA